MTLSENPLPDHSSAKTRFFQDLSLKYLPEMRLLIRGGHLSKKDQWRNVVEHSLVQIAIADVMADMLNLSQEEKTTLMKTAAVHDWNKRILKGRDLFTDEDLEQITLFLAAIDPDQSLINATKPNFIKTATVDHQATFLQQLQYYIDNITAGSEIAPANVRLAEAEVRTPEAAIDPILRQDLGGSYWAKEKELTTSVEVSVFSRLPVELQKQIGAPVQIPMYIKQQIEKKYEQHKSE